MTMHLSVIICTHNPRKSYIENVIDSLKAQTSPFQHWELILVDNASDEYLKDKINLKWHPNSRFIREEKLGLTSARLAGIRESQAETLVFVDDDNVLDVNYIEEVIRISNEFPFLGAWGGQIFGKYEVPPPEWAEPYLPKLGIREFDQIKWSNLVHQYETTPCGAGICVRKRVAEEYARLVSESSERLKLGRIGQALTAGEDSDLAFTACDVGLGMGIFPSLKLTHLIPSKRLEKTYLIRLIEGMNYSQRILDSLRGKSPIPRKITWTSKIKEFYYLRRISKTKREFYLAQQRGFDRAVETLRDTTSPLSKDNV
ncbi:glycosyltransferase family 2 protein [Nodosilinea sp. LEGE 07088]|uniref:glycosyltransferase n=1 Tax=Nodosilinea sp. LEGE 07088 TaxID=2777968 RepID=UPI001881E426|nr:glycosyltransferase [Nodosilinea sp. LEGE 07088]MBE9139437.1 glycosyltransferase family 2 protein [Nodosilinea sp. LEGE 07088]